jgi:hypothetical protein
MSEGHLMRRSLTRTLIAAVSLLLVLVALTATSFAAWRCQFSAAVTASCCCAHGHGAVADETQPARAAMTAPGCCDLERLQVQRAPSDVPRSQPTLATPVVALALTAPPMVGCSVPAQATGRAASAGPPGGGRSVVLQKRAFLI